MTESEAPPRNPLPFVSPLFVLTGWFNDFLIFAIFAATILPPKQIALLTIFVACQRIFTAATGGFIFVTAASKHDTPEEWQWFGIIVASMPLFYAVAAQTGKLPWLQGILWYGMWRDLPSWGALWLLGEMAGMGLGMALAKTRWLTRRWTTRLNRRLTGEDIANK